MMNKAPLPINPGLLRWAREQAGLSPEEAAKRARLKPPRKKRDGPELTAADLLLAWEKGERAPSLSHLEEMAKAYQRPLLTFFLPAPPIQQTSLADFRPIANKQHVKDSPEFSALKRRIEALHDELKEIAALEGFPRLPFVGSVTQHSPLKQIVENIRDVLGFSFTDQQRIQNKEKFISALRQRAHDAGIFILFEGNLGSHHTNISPEEFRGLALAHQTVPLIVINTNDATAARIFTLVHELGHIWFGDSGVSNFDALGRPRLQSAVVAREMLCNALAGEFLIPEAALRDAWQPGDENASGQIERLVRLFKISRAVVARRLLDLDMIADTIYWPLLKNYNLNWEKSKQKIKAQSGPSRNVLDKYRLGQKLVHMVMDAVSNGRITVQEAARMLRVPASRFDKVL